MLNAYLLVKLVHVVSATLLLGTGLGTAFFMYRAHRSRNIEALKVTSRDVVRADWLFTLPAVILQLATGLWLTDYLNIDWASRWIMAVLTLFAVVGLCWIPVIGIQIRISRLADSGGDGRRIARLMRIWTALGIPAFSLTLVLIALMVFKPGLA